MQHESSVRLLVFDRIVIYATRVIFILCNEPDFCGSSSECTRNSANYTKLLMGSKQDFSNFERKCFYCMKTQYLVWMLRMLTVV